MTPSSKPAPASGLPGTTALESDGGCCQEPTAEGTSGASRTTRRAAEDPILCGHCGRTASNGISCIGACVADSGY